jgi:hypothetical protein
LHFVKEIFMISRRQLLINGIGAGSLPFLANREPIANFFLGRIQLVSTELGVHGTVLCSVLDRFQELLPLTGAIIHGNGDRAGACSFELGDKARSNGHWRLDSLGTVPISEQSLDHTIGLACPRLATHLSGGAALHYHVGLHMGGLTALLYEGFGARICLLSRQCSEAPVARALFINL